MDRLSCIPAIVLLACACAPAWSQERPLRLFLSTTGLSDPANVASPAINPTPQLGQNPFVVASNAQPIRLYLWAQITPPGQPAVTYIGISTRVRVHDLVFGSATIVGHNLFNYTNAGQSRWSAVNTQVLSPTEIQFNAAMVASGWGVTNTASTPVPDTHRFRWTPDGLTRIDSTLLGYVEIGTPAGPGAMYEVSLSVGSQFIVRSGSGIQHVHFGWGDEWTSPLGNQIGATSFVSDAFVYHTATPPCDLLPPDEDCDGIPDSNDPCVELFGDVWDFDSDGRDNSCDPCPYGLGGECTLPRGDLDCSGVVDFFDIDPFLLAIFNLSAYQTQYPTCDETLANMNRDGAINFFDIDPFTTCLFGGMCP